MCSKTSYNSNNTHHYGLDNTIIYYKTFCHRSLYNYNNNTDYNFDKTVNNFGYVLLLNSTLFN